MRNLALVYQDFNSTNGSAIDRRYYRDFAFHGHYHINPEITYVSKGSLNVTINGQQMTIEAGQFCLIMPWQIHSYHTPASSESMIIVFPTRYIQLFLQNMTAYSYSTQVFNATQAIHGMFLEYLHNATSPDEYIFSSVLYGLCHCFLEACSLQGAQRSPDSPLLIDIMNYLSEHYSEALSLKDVAARFGYSYYYLSRLFSRNIGLSFHQFLNIRRVEQAAWQLEETDVSVSEIAWKCGFGNIRTFNRVFRQLMGIAPSRYRMESAAGNGQMSVYDADFRFRSDAMLLTRTDQTGIPGGDRY